MIKLIDIGINLMHRNFGQDRKEVMENAEKVGVSPLIITGTSETSSRIAAGYASRFPSKLCSTVGVHPHDAKSCNNSTINELKRIASEKCVVAIGECGLDYNRDFSPRDVQRKIFEEQILLAIDLKMPLFLHERDAFHDFYAALKKHRDKISNLVVHCFTGSERELDAYIDLGCYIGITGWICDERRGTHLRNLVKKIPLDKLMIETDAPFLIPRDLNDKPVNGRNEPKFLPHILKAIAKCVNIDSEELAKITWDNTVGFFQL